MSPGTEAPQVLLLQQQVLSLAVQHDPNSPGVRRADHLSDHSLGIRPEALPVPETDLPGAQQPIARDQRVWSTSAEGAGRPAPLPVQLAANLAAEVASAGRPVLGPVVPPGMGQMVEVWTAHVRDAVRAQLATQPR